MIHNAFTCRQLNLNKLKIAKLNVLKQARYCNFWLLLGMPCLLLSQNTLADEQDPLNFIVGVSRSHDNNLFRSASSERSENITTAYAGIRLDKQYAQQRFKFDFTLTANRYQNYDVLNFNAKDYKAAWLWTLTPYLTGTISLDRKQQLSSFQDYRDASLVNIRNISIGETQHFEADYSPHNVWHLLGGVTRSTQKNTNNNRTAFEGQDSFTFNRVDAGVRYNFRSGSSVTVMSHAGAGDYNGRSINRAALLDNGFDEQEIEARLNWLVSGKSQLNVRTAYVSRDEDHFSERDYSGFEGNIDYSWSPTGKIRLIFSAASDLSSYQTIDSSYSRLSSLSISPVYALSSKISMRGQFGITKRTFQGEGVANLSSDRVDWGKSASLGIDWSPIRSLTVGGNVERSSRNSNDDRLDFKDTTMGVNANLFF